jgi:hypothetical protein
MKKPINILINKQLLIGMWELQSVIRTDTTTGKRTNHFGEKLHGYIIYSANHRMQVEIRGSKGKLAYKGTYTVRGNNVTHLPQVASNPAIVGKPQKRKVELKTPNTLLIQTDGSASAVDGIVGTSRMVWKRAKQQ